MPTDDTSTPSYRAERGEPEHDAAADQSELSLGAMTRGTVGTEGADKQSADDEGLSGSAGAEEDRRQAESPGS